MEFICHLHEPQKCYYFYRYICTDLSLQKVYTGYQLDLLQVAVLRYYCIPKKSQYAVSFPYALRKILKVSSLIWCRVNQTYSDVLFVWRLLTFQEFQEFRAPSIQALLLSYILQEMQRALSQ